MNAAGEWWSPDEPDTRWAGTLRVDDDGASHLTLIDRSALRSLSAPSPTHSILHGITDDGKRVSLHDCFDISSSTTSLGLGRRVIHARFALVGFHSGGADPLVSGASAAFGGSRRWYGRANLKVESFTSMRSVRLAYDAEPEVVLFDEQGLLLKMYSTLTSVSYGFDDEGTYSLKENLRFELEASPERPLSKLNRVLVACKDLLSIATQSFTAVEQWWAYQGTGEKAQVATFHARPVFRDRDSSRHPREMLFRYQDVADAPARYFSRWLKEADRLASIRGLYFSAVYGDHFVQGRFVNLTQALEAFHRRYRSAAPAGLNPQRLARFERSYSLEQRLKDLFHEHRWALEAVVTRPAELIPEIVSRRRRFTHFPVEENDGVYERHDWLGFNALLRFLLELCFLKVAGFMDDELAGLAGRNWQRGRMIRKFLCREGATSESR